MSYETLKMYRIVLFLLLIRFTHKIYFNNISSEDELCSYIYIGVMLLDNNKGPGGSMS